MIPTLEGLLKTIQDKVKALRNIEHLTQSDRFKEDWKSLTDDQKLKVANDVNWLNKDGIAETMKSVKRELGEMTFEELRELGVKRGLKSIRHMSKTTLLSELSKLEGISYDQV